MVTLKSKYSVARGVLALSALALIAAVSCEERTLPPLSSNLTEGFQWVRVHDFSENRFSQFGDGGKPSDVTTIGMRWYTPPGYQDKGLGPPYPTLYLLSPFRGDQFFYFQHGVNLVMDRLIAERKIDPMIVCCLNSSANRFGGSFYGNYLTNGYYELINTTAFVDFTNFEFNTLPGSRLRAISGYEMGGYGAFRCALTSDTAFGAVSAIAAPLFFTDPNFGFPSLFDGAIAEWGSFNLIDTSTNSPISGFLIAAAIGFTPEDTAYVFSSPGIVSEIQKIYDSSVIDTFIDTTIDSTIDTFITPLDTLYDVTFDTTIDTLVAPPDTLVDTIVDSAIVIPPDTMIDTTIDSTIDTALIYNPPTDLTFQAFKDPDTKEDFVLRIFLPFDSTGAPYSLIWDIWKGHDIRNRIDSVRANSPEILDSLAGNALVMATRQPKFGYYQGMYMQDSVFVDYVNSLDPNYRFQFREYSGHDGIGDFDGARFLFDVLPTILKFHSDKFRQYLDPDLEYRIPDSEYVAEF
ncbi:MAG: hypothetical protein IIB00_00715 [candidate division Zixibacteria bacterium]|nr:hypothetical protein [candidate division Zixibacteria bacterium]